MNNNYINHLKQFRKSSKLSILELAQKMGVSPEYILRIEDGEVEPTKEQIEVIKDFIEGRL